jgi:hypothetical protein
MGTWHQRDRRRKQGLGCWKLIRYADLCRTRHKSHYAEHRIMPNGVVKALVSDGW